ncbi:ABC transporter substrate-binding protein [Bosea sp. SSUT16]|jgi:branched-chain amino acid transport system substrate-binding protein|uniref:ABC transporter substrate-binding protein n=1 Tax=Bosea spartocytisi TaxID=2773451 RepID=A0A927EDN1_9HYPH|nr:ABC transporter substrate-binding protein [Bosea spartocytisi]MBD3848105.1 ABC transporter substrate-binding protein [Bosea spartocytisi]MCT4473956.1 ABC transporter substrate-binding protein [Bosea spartocytisi]
MLTRRQFGGFAAGATLLAGTRSSFAQGGAIKIGAINPYSGAMAQYGDEVTRCYELAAEWVNGQGGVLGRQLQIVRGNATSAQEGIAAIEQFVGRDKVDIFAGTYVTAISNAASESALNYSKLYWETNALARDLTDRGLPNFVRSGPSSNEFASRAVDGALKIVATKLGKQPKDLKVWVEHEDSAYGTSIATEQQRLLKAAGVSFGVGAHSARAIDVTDSILRAKNAAPDIWISTAYVVDTNLLLRAARDQGFKPAAIMLCGVGDTTETLEALGKEYLEGIFVVSYPRPDISEKYGPGAGAFLKVYRDKLGRDPIAPQGMNAFVGMKMLFEAVKAAGDVDYEKVVKAAAAMDKPLGTYETGYGAKFDAKMQNTRALPVVAQWQSGRVKAVFPTEAAAEGVTVVNLPRA